MDNRQFVHGTYVLDFYCHELRLAVELDGESHDAASLYDEARTRSLSRSGVHVVRFANEDMLFHLDDVLKSLWREIAEQRERLGGSEHPLP